MAMDGLIPGWIGQIMDWDMDGIEPCMDCAVHGLGHGCVTHGRIESMMGAAGNYKLHLYYHKP